MGNSAVRIRFQSPESAFRNFDGFMRCAVWVDSYARKRSGSEHVVLVRGQDADGVRRFVRWCESREGVVSAREISEAEFWASPSDSV